MAYNKAFFDAYRAYLQEPVVRRNHNLVFKMFADKAAEQSERLWVVDLGCGLCEYHNYSTYHAAYVGVDKRDSGECGYFVRSNYATMGFKDKLPFRPNAFISSFSIECCNPPKKKYALYERIFREIPSIRFGLAGGFFYKRWKDKKKVVEAGGKVVSWQTIEDQKDHVSDLFSEHRFRINTPSKMFGDDVVEIWKFFERR